MYRLFWTIEFQISDSALLAVSLPKIKETSGPYPTRLPYYLSELPLSLPVHSSATAKKPCRRCRSRYQDPSSPRCSAAPRHQLMHTLISTPNWDQFRWDKLVADLRVVPFHHQSCS